MLHSTITPLNGFGGNIICREGPAFVETIDAPGGDLYAIHLAGTHYEMGKQYGAMLGDKILECNALTSAMLCESGLPEDMMIPLVKKAWSHYAKNVPTIYSQELAGIVDGAAQAGFAVTLDMMETLAVIPELTSYWHMEEMIGQLLCEDEEADINPVWDGKERGSTPIHCSAFMAWGNRCEGGNLFGCRNLDWSSDIGMGAFKAVTVFHPVDENGTPGIACATFGYIGMLGSMAGMNAEGIVLSEIGAFNMRETFDGRPWHYVFREVLDGANNIDEAAAIFNKGNYLQGYCFVAGWGDPRRKGSPAHAPKGFSVEVDAENIAILYDNDPKELDAVCVDTKREILLFDGKPVYYGLPLENATFRADCAFAKSVRSGQYADKGPAGENNSGNAKDGRTWRELYVPISNMIKAFNEGYAFDAPKKEAWHFAAGNPHPMTRDDALRVCKMAGDNKDNVMSIFYDASNLHVGVAFEAGSGESWQSASQAGYVMLDFAKVF